MVATSSSHVAYQLHITGSKDLTEEQFVSTFKRKSCSSYFHFLQAAAEQIKGFAFIPALLGNQDSIC
jgi:hypothetical protein